MEKMSELNKALKVVKAHGSISGTKRLSSRFMCPLKLLRANFLLITRNTYGRGACVCASG